MTTFDATAICLKATPFRETDQVVAFYTAEHGELRAIAKGVKKPTSKLAGACEPLTVNQVFWSRGKNLHTVCHYERVESFSVLRQELERLAVGTVCTDLIRHLGRENDPDSEAVFNVLFQTLQALNQPDGCWIESSLRFHTQLLEIAGYLPRFSTCITCEETLNLAEFPYLPFSLSFGGVLCPRCQGRRTDFSHRVNISTVTLQLLETGGHPRFHTHALKAHRFLAFYWGHRLDRGLNSFDFLFQILEGPSAQAAAALG